MLPLLIKSGLDLQTVNCKGRVVRSKSFNLEAKETRKQGHVDRKCQCHSFVLKLNIEDIKVCNRNQSTNQSKHFGFIFWLFTERQKNDNEKTREKDKQANLMWIEFLVKKIPNVIITFCSG